MYKQVDILLPERFLKEAHTVNTLYRKFETNITRGLVPNVYIDVSLTDRGNI
jgi:hypothetical protein